MLKKFFLYLKTIFLAEREIICVSNHGIKSKKIGVVFLIWNILLVFWTFFITVKYFNLQREVSNKNDIISELETHKQNLLANVVVLEKNVDNIKNFIVSLNRFDRFSNIDEDSVYSNVNIAKIDELDIDNKTIDLVLNRTKENLKNVNLALIDRINNIKTIQDEINFDNNIQAVSYEMPINTALNDINTDVLESIVLKDTIDQNLSSLNQLEKFINAMPFVEPMQINYVSSKYGRRLDPFTKRPKEHHGVDIVGPYLSKIYSPAPGKVIFAGIKGGYGKAVIVEHDYGLKTVYGHLNSYNVKAGDKISRGDIIGVQGTTGRSTGHHLHYEIIKGRQRYSPLEFIKVGSNLY